MSRSRHNIARTYLVIALISPFTAAAGAENQQTVRDSMCVVSFGVVNTSDGTMIISYPIEKHQQFLKDREAQMQRKFEARFSLKSMEQLKIESNMTRTTLALREAADFHQQLLDVNASHRERIRVLENATAELRSIAGGDDDNHALDEAITAAQRGDTSKADALFADIEEDVQTANTLAGRAAYQRGVLAYNKADYLGTYKHFKRAAELAPDNANYRIAAAIAAQQLEDYSQAIIWNEHAEQLLQSSGTPDAAKLAVVHSNLGLACYAEHNYDKAIGYFEQALASDLKTCGEGQLKVAQDLNNLGLAWHAKREYDQAVAHYEQALAISEQLLGSNNPWTQAIAAKLESARRRDPRPLLLMGL